MGTLQEQLHFGLFFILDAFSFGSHSPLLDVFEAVGELDIVDSRRGLSQLLEDRHHHELDEASLPTRDLGGLSITEHGDLETKRFLGVALVEELVEEQISPLRADIKLPQRGTDVARVEYGTRDELLGFLDGFGRGLVDESVRVLSIGDLEGLHVLAEAVPESLHFGHVGVDYAFHDSLAEVLGLHWSHF